MSTPPDSDDFHTHLPVTDDDWMEIGLVGFNQGGQDAQILKGINQWRNEKRNWVLRDAGHQEFMLLKLIRNPKIAGIIANVTDHKRMETLQKWGKPVVDTSGILADSPFPQVGVQPGAVGEMGGEFLTRKGFKRIVYVSGMQWTYEMDRWQGLRQYCNEHQIEAWWWSLSEERCVDSVSTKFLPEDADYDSRDPFEFLSRFEKPFAVFTAIDRMGVQICDGCRAAGLNVPGDVAVLGVDDNEYFCESATPPLSSVMLPGEKMGREAMKLLEKLIRGDCKETFVRLEPKGIKARESTEGY
ncbi:MAG: substrate-binding domain-containing protein [Verrucomicrobia bacterium]|nr:substrate-binding domain-containing protein [Verrucomicrobiota bacterium]MCH8511245.1 substrate-binding domain-containing protein [Kiritimatiellia bacterium]